MNKNSKNLPAPIPHFYKGREQTYIKHFVLERYLERVVRNILWSRSEFVFVDGFSGPWKAASENYEDTSFGIAINKLRKVRDEISAQTNQRKKVRCIFVEARTAAFRKLVKATEDSQYIPAIAINGRFEDKIEEIIKLIGNSFVLVLIDPKGWNIDLRKIAPLLERQPTEVLINFMFDHINRFLDDKRDKIQKSYNAPFGTDDWKKRLNTLMKAGLDRESAILELFRSQLKRLGKFTYVSSTKIKRPTSDRPHFFLVYGTKHPKGLIEFREVERKALEAEQVSRRSAKVNQHSAKSGIQDLFTAMETYSPSEIDEIVQTEISQATSFTLNKIKGAVVDKGTYLGWFYGVKSL